MYKYIELVEDYRLNEMKQAGEAIAYGTLFLLLLIVRCAYADSSTSADTVHLVPDGAICVR